MFGNFIDNEFGKPESINTDLTHRMFSPEPDIEIFGQIDQEDIKVIREIVVKALEEVQNYYERLGIKPKSVSIQQKLKVKIVAEANYRSSGQGANTWKFNFLMSMYGETGIVINAKIITEVPDEFSVLINHEIRHAYMALLLGNEVFRSSFPLREGTAGLSVDSTSRLRRILTEGSDALVLPMTISHWDKSLDETETNKRLFIDNPWYLSLFSFFHDYLGVSLQMMDRLIEVYMRMPNYNHDLSLAWREVHPDLSTLDELQEQWLNDTKLGEFVSSS